MFSKPVLHLSKKEELVIVRSKLSYLFLIGEFGQDPAKCSTILDLLQSISKETLKG